MTGKHTQEALSLHKCFHKVSVGAGVVAVAVVIADIALVADKLLIETRSSRCIGLGVLVCACGVRWDMHECKTWDDTTLLLVDGIAGESEPACDLHVCQQGVATCRKTSVEAFGAPNSPCRRPSCPLARRCRWSQPSQDHVHPCCRRTKASSTGVDCRRHWSCRGECSSCSYQFSRTGLTPRMYLMTASCHLCP